MKNLVGLIAAVHGVKDFPHRSSLEQARGRQAVFLEIDTLRRVVLDLHQAALYADRDGLLRDVRQRQYLALVDGVHAAGTDMFAPSLHPLRAALVADQPTTADAVAARPMGHDAGKLHGLVATAEREPGLGRIDPAATDQRLAPALQSLADAFSADAIVPPDGGAHSWRGRIEADDDPPMLLEPQRDACAGRLRVRVPDAAGDGTPVTDGQAAAADRLNRETFDESLSISPP